MAQVKNMHREILLQEKGKNYCFNSFHDSFNCLLKYTELLENPFIVVVARRLYARLGELWAFVQPINDTSITPSSSILINKELEKDEYVAKLVR